MERHNKFRFAIVGAGVISEHHARAISAHPEAELVAVSDVHEAKAREFAEKYGGARVYQDYEEMLRADDIDAVTVCTPSGMHSAVTIAAAECGKHVLCEKPLDIRKEAMDAMIHACRKHHVKLSAVFQKRTTQIAAAVRKALQEEKLGKLVLGDVYMKYYRSREYYASAGWRGTWQWDGGGALMNQGVHGVDLLLHLMGDVDSVFAYAAPLVHEIEVEDTAIAAVKYKNGAFGVIQGTTSVYPGMDMRMELHGDRGSIIFNDHGFQMWKFEAGDEAAPSIDEPSGPFGDGYVILIDDLIRSVRENRDPLITGESARKAVDLVLAIYESARTGREVKLAHE